MDCKDARLLLDFARPRVPELEATEADALTAHLADCVDCAAVAQAERRLDDHLGRAVRDVPLPDGLRERLLKRLDAERDAWYRRLVGRVLGAAAALFVVGWLGWHFILDRRPEVNTEAVRENSGFSRVLTASRVEEWFRQRGVGGVAVPAQFDARWLTLCELTEFQGRRVPLLLYARNDGGQVVIARVYVLSKGQFNLEPLEARQALENSGQPRIQILPNPDNPQSVFLVVFTGESLTPFLDRNKIPQGI